MTAGPSKLRKLAKKDEEGVANIPGEDNAASENDDTPEDLEEESSLATADEIELAQQSTKSKKTQKRKRRATSPSAFGSTLLSLLNTDAPSNNPLSLRPSVTKKVANEALEVKAKKLLDGERKEKEERNHVVDVIGGWGGESERALRKVAQRGVVKLFNAIQQTQSASVIAQDEAKANRGSGKPTLSAPDIHAKGKRNGKKGEISASAKSSSSSAMGQDAFLQMIKSGGIVSKA